MFILNNNNKEASIYATNTHVKKQNITSRTLPWKCTHHRIASLALEVTTTVTLLQ